MNLSKRLTFGLSCVPIGLGLLYGSTGSWWPTMPDILQLGSAVTGFALVSYGVLALLAHWCAEKQQTICKKYIEIIDSTENLFGGFFVPVSFTFIVLVGTLGWGYSKASMSNVSVVFEYPSNIDFAQNPFSITMLISNETERPVSIDDFRLIEILSNSKVYSPYEGLNLCQELTTVEFSRFDDIANPAGSPPIHATAKGYSVFTVKALSFSVDGQKSSGSLITLDAHKGSEIVVSYPKLEHEDSKWNSTSACTFFRAFNSQLGAKRVVCSGATRLVFPVSEYDDRLSQVDSNRYAGLTHKSDTQGFGVIYQFLKRSRKITDRPESGNCG